MNAFENIVPPVYNKLDYVLLSISSLRPNFYLPFSPSTTTIILTKLQEIAPSQAIHVIWRSFPSFTAKKVGNLESKLVPLVSSFQRKIETKVLSSTVL